MGIREIGASYRAARLEGWGISNSWSFGGGASIAYGGSPYEPAEPITDIDGSLFAGLATVDEKKRKLDEVAREVRRYRAPRLKAFAKAWACYCAFPSRFPRPATSKDTRRVELSLARVGVVDPTGGAIDGVPF